MLNLNELAGKPFPEWIKEIYNRTAIRVSNICNPETAFINYDKLKAAAVAYSIDSLEVVTSLVTLNSELEKEKDQYKQWYDLKFVAVKEELEKKGQKSPAITTIESYIRSQNSEEYLKWQEKLRDMTNKLTVLQKMESSWRTAADIYVSLIYAHRVEAEKFNHTKSVSAAVAVQEMQQQG